MERLPSIHHPSVRPSSGSLFLEIWLTSALWAGDWLSSLISDHLLGSQLGPTGANENHFRVRSVHTGHTRGTAGSHLVRAQLTGAVQHLRSILEKTPDSLGLVSAETVWGLGLDGRLSHWSHIKLQKLAASRRWVPTGSGGQQVRLAGRLVRLADPTSHVWYQCCSNIITQ